MKNYLKTFLLLFFTIFMVNVYAQSTAWERAARIEKGYNLANWLEARWMGGDYPVVDEYSAADMQLFSQLGFNTVRVPVSYEYIINQAPPYNMITNQSVFDLVDNVIIPAADNCDMTVLLVNHHGVDLTDANFMQEMPRVVAQWQFLTQLYADLPHDRYFFELRNEPKYISNENLKIFQQAIIDGIREYDTERTLIVGANTWNSAYSLVTTTPYNDPQNNIIYTFHSYDPIEFTHQGMSWDLSHPAGVTFSANSSQANALRNSIINAKNWSQTYNVPVYWGEFGVSWFADAQSRCEYIQFTTQTANELDIPWIYWDIKNTNDAFGIFENGVISQNTIIPCFQSAMGLSYSEDCSTQVECPPYGTPCNDGNPNTINDIHNGFCTCAGTPVQNEDCELLANNDFDNNTDEWFTWGSAASYAASTVTLSNISAGNAAWFAGFKQEGVTLEQGKNYTINFRARADVNNRPLTVKAGLAGEPWTPYFREDLNISTTMQNYTYSFTMTNTTDINAGFEFMFGTNAANIYIESASVQESDCGGSNCPPEGTACDDNNPATTNDIHDGNCNCIGTPCPTQGTACNDNNPATINDQQDGFCNCVGTPCPAQGTSCDDGNPNTINDVQDGFCNCAGTPVQNEDCELLANNDFDNNTDEWFTWGSAASYAASTVTLSNISAGDAAWFAGFKQEGVTLEQGKNYTINFRARSDANNRPLTVKAGLAGEPWTPYFREDLNISTTMQNYTYSFTMTNTTDTNAGFEFMFGTNAANIYIESASVQESDCGGSNCPPTGTACDDNNPATTNDIHDGNCNCIGTPCPTQGTTCNDNNPATINDQQDGFCNCVGTPCPAQGTSCDDGNPNTINDVENGFCNCAGTPVQNNDCNEFSETFDGAPDAPTSFYGDPNWAIFITERDEQYTLPASTADHGPNCEPPIHLNPSDTYETTHTVTEFEDAVYICRNHLMTNIHGLNFGIINMTPDHLLDFSAGEAVISVDVSTWDQAATARDWWTITLQNPDDFDPLAGMQYSRAKNTLWIETGYNNGKRYPTISMSDADFNKIQLPIAGYTALEDLITPSKTARTTYELRVQRNYVKFGIKLPNNQGYHWWVDTGVDAYGNPLNLTWDKAMVMLGHYSYNPRKDGGGTENTWHWDNVSMSPTVPITVIGTDARFANSNRPTLNLDTPAPANAQLVLTAPDIQRIGNSLQVSFNGGATWNNLTRVTNSDYDPADVWTPGYHVFKTAIPAGTTQLTFNGIDNEWQDWMAKDVYVISDTPASNCNNKQDLGTTPDIKLYPNPANHSIQLVCELSENTQAQIHITDAFGRLVRDITEVELIAGSPLEMNVTQLPAGIYFYTVKSDEWQAVKKFVIAR